MVITQIPGKRRRSIRLKGYDYTGPGAYFVTVCTHRWQRLFGEVDNGKVRLSTAGQIVETMWLKIPDIRPQVILDEFVVMPNHLHGIIMIYDRSENVRATQWVAPTGVSSRPQGPARHSLGAIIGQFKGAATKRINMSQGTPGQSVWRRNYYEHIIRNDSSLNRVREYITCNAQRWHLDRYNPAAIGQDGIDRWSGGIK